LWNCITPNTMDHRQTQHYTLTIWTQPTIHTGNTASKIITLKSPSQPASCYNPSMNFFLRKNKVYEHWQTPSAQGRNRGWKVEGDQGLGPNTGAHASRAPPKPGWVLRAGRGPPPAVKVRGYHSLPREFVKT